MQEQSFKEGVAGVGLLNSAEDEFVSRYRGTNRLQCAALLKFFQAEGRFPRTSDDLYRFFGSDIECSGSYNPQSGTSIRQRADIREFLGFRPPKTEDYTHAQDWLCSVAIQEPDDKRAYDYVRQWFWDNRIELPVSNRIDRIISSALTSFEDQLFQGISAALPDHGKQAIDGLFVPGSGEETDGTTAPFSLLKQDPGKPSLNSVFAELSKLAEIDGLDLPARLFAGIPQKVLSLYRHRAATESIRDMRRHPDHIRYTLAAAFCYERRQEIVDGLIELLIQIVHTIRVRCSADAGWNAAHLESKKSIGNRPNGRVAALRDQTAPTT